MATPQVYLKTLEVQQSPRADRSPTQLLIDDLGALCGIARRARRRLEQGVMQKLLPGEPEQLAHQLSCAQDSAQSLFTRMQQETGHAG